MPWFYYIIRAIIRVIVLLLTRFQVEGQENIPTEGPLLVVANHLSLADPPLLGISIKRKTAFMAKRNLFRCKAIGYFIRGFGAFPIDRERLDREGIRQTYQVLSDGLVLVMFPEGTRSRNGQLRPAFSGAARIASRSGVPILPVAISGTEQIEHPSWLFKRPVIKVHFGEPFYLPRPASNLSRQELINFTEILMQRIAEILPRQYRGNYDNQN